MFDKRVKPLCGFISSLCMRVKRVKQHSGFISLKGLLKEYVIFLACLIEINLQSGFT